MAFQISPGVNVSEIDLTTVVPAVSTTAGAFAGPFQWGPVGQRNLVSHETDLTNKFGPPNSNTATSFFSAANFLAYGNNLQVVRVANTNSKNAGANNSVKTIKNEDDYDTSYIVDELGQSFVARYPGERGNSLRVSIWDSNTANAAVGGSTFNSWTYRSLFPAAPSTSTYVSSSGGTNDQFHMVVVDEDGLFSQGVKGTVLEVFPYLSKASDAVTDDGSTSYYRTVLRNQSRYVYALGPVDSANTSGTWGRTANTQFSGAFMATSNVGSTVSLTSGSDLALNAGDYTTGYSQFTNPDEVDVSLVVTGDAGGSSTLAAVQQYAIDSIATARKDCVVFISPPQTGIVGGTAPETAIATWINSTLQRVSTYAVADCGWKYQFDKYNNLYRWIPLNGDIAGLCVRTDQTRDPWFSPAGVNRGAIKNVVKLAWNPTQAQRDAIYSIGVNPVVSLPGQGTILFGDKTLTTQPSAFDRINVRRLFIVLEKAISSASKFSLFELNDEFTRAQFVALVEPFLRDVKGRRGIFDFRVVCDTTNNTANVIDNNRFVGDIYIKPARSVNYIQLNFVAVRTGVSFTEIVGGV
jgi:hypothetical protein